jgi:hypothetical protein
MKIRSLRTKVRFLSAALFLVVLAPAGAAAEDRYTLIISGASGDPKYAANYERWRATLVTALRAHPEFRDDHLIVLAETPAPGVGRASREGVRRALAGLRQKMTADATLFLILFGHGSFDGIDAKFNLVGPDLEAGEWEALLSPLAGRLVFVNTTNASFPFLRRLAGPQRVLITATDSAVQRYDTVFPEFFVTAVEDAAADTDKNGRVSVWEAFAYASARVRRWYEQRGQLATERPILDDSGDGIGKEADQPGPDGAVASRVYVGAGIELPAAVADPALAPLVARRDALEAQLADLKARKDQMEPDQYAADLERLLIELARVSRQIRLRAASS